MNADRLLALYGQVEEAPDGIDQLRGFVLDLAVRGKLVPQNPVEAPASDLLKQISAEKARLVKAGAIRTTKPIPPVEEPPYALPLTWEWTRFGDIVDFVAGRTPSRNEPSFWNTGDFAWVSISDLRDGKTVLATKETVSDKARLNIFKSEPTAPGTMIMSFKLTIGKIARLGIPAYHNEAIISIRPHLDELERYLFLVLPELARAGETKGAIKGATLNRESISKIIIPLPPLAEQERIVAKVDELMALCDKLEVSRTEWEETRTKLTKASLARLCTPVADDEEFHSYARFAVKVLPTLTARSEQVKYLRQTILNLAVQGRLVEQDPDDEPAAKQVLRISMAKCAAMSRRKSGVIGVTTLTENGNERLPKGWSLVRLDDLAISMRYGTSIRCNYDDALTPVLRIPNVSNGEICIEDLKFGSLTEGNRKALALIAGDLLMIRSNGSLDIVGRSAVVTPDAEGMSFAGYLVRFRTLNEQLYTRYVWLALNSDAVREQIERPIRSTVGLKNVNLTEFGRLSFWLPPIAEQHRIVAKVDFLTSLCDRLESDLAAADTTRCKLLEVLLQEALDSVDEGPSMGNN